VKIGTSQISAAARLSAFKRADAAGIPISVDRSALAVLDEIPGSYPAERTIHGLLKDQALGNEWFDLGPTPEAIHWFREAARVVASREPVAGRSLRARRSAANRHNHHHTI